MSFDWNLAIEQEPPRESEAKVQWLQDKDAVRETIHRWMSYVDQRQWSELRDCFDANVYVDYTGLRPQPPAAWKELEDLIASWRARYDTIIAYQHHIGSFIGAIDGDVARCTGGSITTHHRRTVDGVGTELWQVGATHRWQLGRMNGRWRITHIAASKVWERLERLSENTAT